MFQGVENIVCFNMKLSLYINTVIDHVLMCMLKGVFLP